MRVEAALEILKMKPLPDGAFITNDFSAAVCIQTLKDYGIKIPDDIAVVGFNNETISKIIEPQLTTIHYPGIDMGEIAARDLINHLRGVRGAFGTDHPEIIIKKPRPVLKKATVL